MTEAHQPSRPRVRLRSGWLVIALALGGCSLAPAPKLPESVSVLPESYDERGTGAAYQASDWWAAFEDPTLDMLVDSVLTSNFDLAEAVGRVEQARAQARIAKAAYFPVVSATGSVSESNTPANAGFGAQFQQLTGGAPGDSTSGPTFDRIAITTYSASIDFAYELDFWGRVRNDARAAGSDLMASEADLHAAQLGVIAETVSTYFEIVDLRARVRLAQETVSVLEEREALTQTRYDRGLVTSFELYQVRQDLQTTQAQLPQLETALTDAEGRLAIVTGRFSRALAPLLPDSLSPTLPSTDVVAGVPADLLYQRPDVRAAGERLDAARFRWGARRAELLPTLSFSGSIGVQSSESDGLFNVDQWFRNLAANLTAPLFQGGRLRANVDVAEAQFEQQAAAFGRTVLTAVHEVEASLAQLENEARRYAFLNSQLQEANASLDLQASRYASGVAGYTDYLDAYRNLLNVRSTLATAGRDLGLARLAVHRALGGAWTDGDRLPEPRWTEVTSEPAIDPRSTNGTR